jgi:effector-binding domain-containing protein
MIVRISGEDQYRLGEDERARVNELESAVIAIVDSGREDGFIEAYAAMLEYVRTHGRRVGEEEIETSDVILPPADLSFAEAGRDFNGEGLIPD